MAKGQGEDEVGRGGPGGKGAAPTFWASGCGKEEEEGGGGARGEGEEAGGWDGTGGGVVGLDGHLLRHPHALRHAHAALHLLLRHAVALLRHTALLAEAPHLLLLLRLVVVEHAHDVVLLVGGRRGLAAVEGGAEARRVAKVAEAALALRLLRCRRLEAAEGVLGGGRRRGRHGLVEGEEVGAARRLRHGRRHGHARGGGRRRGTDGRG